MVANIAHYGVKMSDFIRFLPLASILPFAQTSPQGFENLSGQKRKIYKYLKT
jgi:hypothetical protein